jgi:hypothetical protein
MNNNPVSFNDALGDTARFYSSQGALLGQENDGSKRITPTIISDDKLDDFRSNYNTGRKHFDNEKAFANSLQKMGTTYDTKSFSDYFEKNKNAFPATKVLGVSLEDKKDFKVNNKPVKLFSEVGTRMNVANGTVIAGNDQYTNNDLRAIDIPFSGSKPPLLHLHQFAGDDQLDFKYKAFNGTGSYKFTGGPSGSGGDQDVAAKNKNGIRDVLVDEKFIYLINGNSNQDIKIPRQ